MTQPGGCSARRQTCLKRLRLFVRQLPHLRDLYESRRTYQPSARSIQACGEVWRRCLAMGPRLNTRLCPFHPDSDRALPSIWNGWRMLEKPKTEKLVLTLRAYALFLERRKALELLWFPGLSLVAGRGFEPLTFRL